MKAFPACLAMLFLICPIVVAWDDNTVVYAVGMGMFAKETHWQTKVLVDDYNAGKINLSQCQNGLAQCTANAAFFNRFLRGNFNNSIYLKWKMPVYSI